MKPLKILMFSRLLIGLVILINLQCAVLFLVSPHNYMHGFGLNGIPGITITRGMGILFIMWNIPYIVAFLHPVKFIISLYESIVMQMIGVAGETVLYLSLPPGFQLIKTTAYRFIIFDSLGLLALLLALWVVQKRLLIPRKSFPLIL
jgi:hypothetical protein